MQTQSVCPTCGGDGKTITKKCPHCNGEGIKSEEEVITINIPAGEIGRASCRERVSSHL